MPERSLEDAQTRLVCKDNCQLSRLVEMATYDDLTKVLNRKAIIACLENEFRRIFRHKYPLSILLIDLDHFKRINDTQGHLQGDFVLKEASKKMKEVLRQEDYLGRYGGDEFLGILPHTDFEGAMVVAKRLVEEFGQTPLGNGKTTLSQTMTLSIGVASHETGDTLISILERADRALYQSKGEGRGRCSGKFNG